MSDCHTVITLKGKTVPRVYHVFSSELSHILKRFFIILLKNSVFHGAIQDLVKKKKLQTMTMQILNHGDFFPRVALNSTNSKAEMNEPLTH